MSIQGHKYSASLSQNHKAQLANAYNELGKELSSTKIKVVGNYTLGRVIGEGTYGTVRLGTHRLTSTRVAIKQIPKAMSAALTREIHHHRRLHHPHVCKLYEVIATESTIWLVTELCSGGELFDYLAEKGRLSEDESKTIFGQLCLAVAYIHEKGVVHRDLKLENVLLDERCRVKLGDFGFTREFERGALLDTYCGTTGYAAPEMLLGKKYLGPGESVTSLSLYFTSSSCYSRVTDEEPTEVDIWSMGIILYCLLTGTLPFDDDDESIMREKIIIGEFENPDWLSADARDLLAHILQHDPSKRLTIPQILAHPWFSRPPPTTAENENEAVSATSATYPISSSTSVPRASSAEPSNSVHHLPSPSPSTSEASFHSAPSQQSSPLYQQPTSSISARDESPDESVTMVGVDDISFDSNASEATVKQLKENGRKHHEKDVAEPASRRKKSTSTKGSGEREGNGKKVSLTLEEEEFPMSGKQLETTRSQNASFPHPRDPSPSQKPLPSPSFGGQSPASAPPTAYPTRTPARTKRRSVSSILSQPSSPTSDTGDHQHAHFPPQDFAALLRTPAPLLFSTPLERSLLNNLSALGFDIGQMVHSVLSDACDASGAIWWMLKRKAEKKALEAAFEKAAKAKQAEASAGVETEIETELENNGPLNLNQPSPGLAPGSSIPEESNLDEIDKTASGTASKSKIDQSHPAPELTFIPPTPTVAATQGDSSQQQQQQQQRKKSTSPPVTPPRSKSPRSYLSPTPTSMDSPKSNPSTPNAKDKDKDSKSRSSNSSGKPRSGSVSIVQRATMTALEAAGLVRKRSAEAVKEKEDKEKERDKEKEKDDQTSSSLDSRNSHQGNGHNGPARLTKSPPIRPVKDHKDNHSLPPLAPPVTPERERTIPTSLPSASPWIPVSRSSTFTTAPPTLANSPGNTNNFGVGEHHHHTKLMGGPLRNRSSLLTTFRMWFNEDRKGKRKASVPPPINITSSNSSSAPGAAGGVPASPRAGGGTRGGTFKRRGGWNGPKPRAKRASISSRRSSSVNSRRSSVASMQMVLMERDSTAPHHTGTGGMVDISRQRSDASRRSFTPNSEAEREVHSSRPSSTRSYSMQNNGTNRHHRKSPSAGSGASAARYASGGGAPPLKQYHRRAGSSSSTRVIRQARTSSHQSQLQNRPAHVRSNSTTSSVHSLPSSRPGSFYDASEGESRRTDSPFRDDSSRRGGYKNKANTVLLAQKKHTALGVPSAYTSSFMTSVSSSRSSWKKAWGTEPPGWQSRPSQYPVEVLAISPAPDQPITIRDVFSGQGRQSLNLNSTGTGGCGGTYSSTYTGGDESDWVDEDEDFPAFAGGLGQIPLNKTSSSTRQVNHNYDLHPVVQLLPVPFRGNRNTRRTGRTSNRGGGGGGSGARVRGVAGHSPITGTMPLPGSDSALDAPPGPSMNVNEPRLSRRNLPNSRAHPAFKSAIVEEDEEEEE